MPLTKIVPKRSLQFYQKMVYSSISKQTQNREENESSYKLIALKLSYGTLEFFSAEFKVLEVNEMEKCIVVKIMPNLDGVCQARLMVDSEHKIRGNNSQVLSVLGLPELNLMELKNRSRRSLDELIPGIKDVFSLNSMNNDDLRSSIGLRLNKFSSQVLLGKDKGEERKGISCDFQARVDKLDDCEYHLVRIWRAKERILGSSTQMASITSANNISINKRKKLNSAQENLDVELESSILYNSLILNPEKAQSVLRFEFKLTRKLEFLGNFVQSGGKESSPTNDQPNRGPSFKNLSAAENKANKPSEPPKKAGSYSSGVVKAIRRALRFQKSNTMLDENQNYGEGIRTMRLVNGDLREVYDDDDEDSLMGMENSDLNSSNTGAGGLFRNSHELKQLEKSGKSSSTYRRDSLSRRSRRQKISQEGEKVITSIQWFKLASIFWTLASTVLIFIYFFDDRKQLKGINDLISIERNTLFHSNNLQEIYYITTELCLLNSGINILYDTEYADQTEQKKTELMEHLRMWTKRLESVNNQFERIKLTLPEFTEIVDARLAEVVTIKTGQDLRNFTYSQAIRQVISNIHIMAEMRKEEIKFGNKAVDFTRFNLIQGIYSRTYYIILLINRLRDQITESLTSSNLYRLNIALYLNIGLGLIGYLAIYCANIKKEEAVETFYGFSDEYIQSMEKRSERFVEFIQNEEAKVGHEPGDNLEEIAMIRGDSDSEGTKNLDFTKNAKNRNFENLNILRKDSKNNFLKLKKRKKKGSLVPIISCWQFIWLGILSLNVLFSWVRLNSQIKIVGSGTKASSYIYVINVLSAMPIIFQNSLMEGFLNPAQKVRGRTGIVIAYLYSVAFANTNRRLFNVRKMLTMKLIKI